MPYQRKAQRREHSAEETAVILTLHSIGYSAGNISLQTSIPKSTVSFILRRLKKNKDHEYQKAIRTGRPRKLSDRGERRLIRHVSRDPFTTLASLGTPSKSGSGLSLCTTRRYLARNEYYAFRPRRKPYLTKTHKKNRLRFARRMQYCGLVDVACFCFSDESTFEIGIDTGPPWVRRKLGKAYESQNLKPTFKSGRSSVGIWGAISMDFKSDLVILPRGERMTSKRYISMILNTAAHPFYEKVMEHCGDAIWQEDGAPYHTSKLTRDYEKSLVMAVIDWPAQSPDLNPIENLWATMKLRISKRRHRISCIEEMEDVLREEWDKLTAEDWRKCVASFQARCKAVIKNRGGMTRY